MTYVLPSGEVLLKHESLVRHQGTGLLSQELLGRWRLRQVWGKGQTTPSPLAGLGLRAAGATLELGLIDEGMAIANAVRLGPFRLRFNGTAALVGRRPLLQFSFEEVELRCAERLLWRRQLAAPSRQRLPFFALIARDPSGWLAARGRGGGLALWQIDSAGA
jgi:hypothetical protein